MKRSISDTRWRIAPALGLALVLGCAAETVDLDEDLVEVAELPGAGDQDPISHLDPGNCGSHLWLYRGGADSGGITFYHSNCSSAYLAYYRYGGRLYQYSSAGSAPPHHGQEFCKAFPSVGSCYPYDPWCAYDDDEGNCP